MFSIISCFHPFRFMPNVYRLGGRFECKSAASRKRPELRKACLLRCADGSDFIWYLQVPLVWLFLPCGMERKNWGRKINVIHHAYAKLCTFQNSYHWVLCYIQKLAVVVVVAIFKEKTQLDGPTVYVAEIGAKVWERSSLTYRESDGPSDFICANILVWFMN